MTAEAEYMQHFYEEDYRGKNDALMVYGKSNMILIGSIGASMKNYIVNIEVLVT